MNASSWSASSVLAPSANPSLARPLVGLADGRAALTWRTETDHTIWVSRLDAAGVWEAPRQLASGSSAPTANPTVAADATGNLVVTWPTDRAWVTRFDAAKGTWSEPHDLGPVEINGGASEVAFLAPGRPLVVWPTLAFGPQQIMVARWDPDAAAWNTITLTTLNSDEYISGYDGIRVQTNEGGDAVVSWRLYHAGVDSHGELWAALYQGGQWRCAQALIMDGDPGQDIALTRDGDLIVVTQHHDHVRQGWHASAFRYSRQLDAWSRAHEFAADAGSPVVGADATGTATVIYGAGETLWAARQTCRN